MDTTPGDPNYVDDNEVLLRRVPARHIEREHETNAWKRQPDGSLRIKPQAFDDSPDGSAMTTWCASEVTIEDLLSDAGDEADFCAIVSITAAKAREIGQVPLRDDPTEHGHVGVSGPKTKTDQKKFLKILKVEREPKKSLPPPDPQAVPQETA